MKGQPPDLTGLLRAWSAGDPGAADRLLPLVYEELRQIAARHMRRERPDHTLRPSALVHEAYLRLASGQGPEWANRKQFLGAAAQVMRRVLVDHARQGGAGKRAGGDRVTLDEGAAVGEPKEVDVLDLERALEALAAVDPDKVRLVELRYFAGLTIDEAAEALGSSAATVSRDWTLARAWLYRRLAPAGQP